MRHLKEKGILVSSLPSTSEWPDTSPPAPESPPLPYASGQEVSDIKNIDLSNYLFKPSISIFNDAAIKSQFLALLGDDYSIFYASLSESTYLEFNSNFYIGSGCATASCGTTEAAFAIDRESGKVFASIVTDSHAIKSFGGAPGPNFPSFLNDWVSARAIPG